MIFLSLSNALFLFSVAVTADWNPDIKPRGVHFAVLASPFLDGSREACFEFTFAGKGEGMKLLISRYMYGIVPTASYVLGYSVLREGASFTGQVDILPVSDRYRVLITLQYSAFMSVTLTNVVHTHAYCTQRGKYHGLLPDEMQTTFNIHTYKHIFMYTLVSISYIHLSGGVNIEITAITHCHITIVTCRHTICITLNFRICYKTH